MLLLWSVSAGVQRYFFFLLEIIQSRSKLTFFEKKIAVQITAQLPFFVGASLIHPSFVDVKDAEGAGAPILALPSKDEPDMVT